MGFKNLKEKKKGTFTFSTKTVFLNDQRTRRMKVLLKIFCPNKWSSIHYSIVLIFHARTMDYQFSFILIFDRFFMVIR